MTKKHYCPLRLQMVFCFILGAACAVAIYFGVSRLGTYLIDRYYLDETATLRREQALLESFDDYVQARNLTSEDSDAIGAWAEDMKYAYILDLPQRCADMRKQMRRRLAAPGGRGPLV